MMIKLKWMSAYCAVLLLGFTACQQPAANETTQNADDATTDTVAATETTEAEADAAPEEEDKSQRASPPASAQATIGGANVTINYGAPSVRGRAIWGDLVPYDKVWRTGANECTTFETDKDVTVNGEALAAGKYALFTIPAEGAWTIIFNSNSDQWGAYDYDEAQDVLRVTAETAAAAEQVERMLIAIDGETGEASIQWDQLSVPFTIAVAGS